MNEERKPEYTQCGACGHVKLHHQPSCALDECSCPGFEVMSGESITCPSRMNPWTAHAKIEGVDHWERNSWHRYDQWRRWPEGFDPPRTCSFCGGAHPDDVIALIERGWEVDGTDKAYKRYLEPPGYRAQARRWTERLHDASVEIGSEIVGPVPPVKVYGWHFSEAQRERFNEAIVRRIEPRP